MRNLNIKKGTIPQKDMSPFVFLLLCFLSLTIFTGAAYCENAAELNSQGLKYLEAKDYKSAVLALEQAYDLEPGNRIISKNLSIAYHYLASRLSKGKKWPDAVSYEKKAHEKDPTNPIYSEQIAIYYNNYALSLFKKGRYDLALANFKEALRFNAANKTVKNNIYNTTLKEARASLEKGRAQEAINLARDCIDYNPGKSSAYVFLGNIYYQQNKLKETVEYWNKALGLSPATAGLKEIIAKAKRELEVEEDFKTRARAYFNIRFEGERDPDSVWDVIDMLGDARRKVKSDFGFFIDKKITVIIYNAEQFRQATQKLDWTRGIYDGKIRLRIGDVLSEQEIAKRLVYHEYGHAVLHILYPKNIPVWLHEGFAQLAEPEGKLNQQDKNLLSKILRRKEPFKLKQMGSLFKASNPEEINTGYLMSKLFLKYLIGRYGKYKFKKLLERLNSGASLEKTVHHIYRSHIKDIEKAFISSLRA